MRIREPYVAGQFYPRDRAECENELYQLLAQSPNRVEPFSANQRRWVGGLVPHAGWTYSGAVAAKVFKTLANEGAPDVIVLFGGVHRYRGKEAAMFGSGRWETPIGSADIEERLAERILGHTNLIVDDPFAHENEHSIEVQVPFIRYLFPEAKIVPIMVPSDDRALEVGQAIGRTLTAYKYHSLIVGTTDLTHYGPGYGFAPKGVGTQANQWASRENDKRFINLVLQMQSGELVKEAKVYHNACSSGAAAATVTATEALGSREGVLLSQTSSSEVAVLRTGKESDDSVGYAGIVFR